MKTTLIIDDDLLEAARAFTGIRENAEMVQEALRCLIAREVGRQLAAFGGRMPHLKPIRRRRSAR